MEDFKKFNGRKGLDIFSFSTLLFPMHVDNNHRILFVDLKLKHIDIFNSLKTGDYISQGESIKNFLMEIDIMK